VTSAAAAAAALGQSLTCRGVSDTLILTTGMSRAGAPLPDCTRFAGPGTTTAFYMSVQQATRIADALRARGLSGATTVQVAREVSKSSEALSHCRLDQLPQHFDAIGCTGCAIVLVTWPEAKQGAETVTGQPLAIVADSVHSVPQMVGT
jgi:uroporphyrin-III C-methyltransferase/precorrin-2 dehydrogenase/sirohydrochlorin ferrochelatase